LVIGLGLIGLLVYFGIRLRDYDVIKHIKSTLGS